MVNIAILRLAAEHVFMPLWSAAVLGDLRSLSRETRPGSSIDFAERVLASVSKPLVFEDATASRAAFVHLSELEVGPRAYNVIEAAVLGRGSSIVTTRLSDYPFELMDELSVVVQQPDDFLCSQVGLRPHPVFFAFENWAASRRRRHLEPATCAGLLGLLKPEVPRFVELATLLMS